jgi:hypothetical protein
MIPASTAQRSVAMAASRTGEGAGAALHGTGTGYLQQSQALAWVHVWVVDRTDEADLGRLRRVVLTELYHQIERAALPRGVIGSAVGGSIASNGPNAHL